MAQKCLCNGWNGVEVAMRSRPMALRRDGDGTKPAVRMALGLRWPCEGCEGTLMWQ